MCLLIVLCKTFYESRLGRILYCSVMRDYFVLYIFNTLFNNILEHNLILYVYICLIPHCEQVLCVWSMTRKPPSTQVPWTSHGRMSCAVTHHQPTSLWRETTRTHRRQTALNQTSHIIPAAALGTRQPNHILMSSLAVSFFTGIQKK